MKNATRWTQIIGAGVQIVPMNKLGGVMNANNKDAALSAYFIAGLDYRWTLDGNGPLYRLLKLVTVGLCDQW